MNYADLYVVQDGEATIHYGGTMEGTRKEVNIGEFRGEKIVGGTRQKVVAGDILSVPAGMPHIWEVEDGKTVVYFTIKIPQAGHGAEQRRAVGARHRGA